jgi:hypothetical protein
MNVFMRSTHYRVDAFTGIISLINHQPQFTIFSVVFGSKPA